MIKICGIKTLTALKACESNGADLVGFVHFEKSPRHVSLSLASELAKTWLKTVVLLVNPTLKLCEEVVRQVNPNYIQLHGEETPAFCTSVKSLGVKVIKALPIESYQDLSQILHFKPIADIILLDAKPPKGAIIPGGNGLSFDWKLLEKLDLTSQFMLSGGLTPLNVETAIKQTHVSAVDVSSGVEKTRGEKDLEQIARFIEVAKRGFKPC